MKILSEIGRDNARRYERVMSVVLGYFSSDEQCYGDKMCPKYRWEGSV